MKVIAAIDIGTGSTRAALVDTSGHVVFIASRSYDQIVPTYGWAEQRAEDWWTAACETLRAITAEARVQGHEIEAVVACGQMHGTVLIDADGLPARETVPLWNDKRTLDYVRAFEAREELATWLPLTANPPTPAWPA